MDRLISPVGIKWTLNEFWILNHFDRSIFKIFQFWQIQYRNGYFYNEKLIHQRYRSHDGCSVNALKFFFIRFFYSQKNQKILMDLNSVTVTHSLNVLITMKTILMVYCTFQIWSWNGNWSILCSHWKTSKIAILRKNRNVSICYILIMCIFTDQIWIYFLGGAVTEKFKYLGNGWANFDS